MLGLMYNVDDLEKQSETWSDVLLDRDWSMLRGLVLSTYANTQMIVGLLMILPVQYLI